MPFIYGLENTAFKKEIELSRDIPSLCASKLLANQVDIGLIPVAMIPKLEYSSILTNYCIGATGKVRTVVLVSEVPLQEIETILMDSHSRTSVLLARILAREYWGIAPEWKPGCLDFEKHAIEGTTAGVIIGDKVFDVEKRFPYTYDLSEHWTDFTGLDFIFACWTANKPIDRLFEKKLNDALKYGLDSLPEVITLHHKNFPTYNLEEYYKDAISFEITERKQKGLELFWKYAKKIES